MHCRPQFVRRAKQRGRCDWRPEGLCCQLCVPVPERFDRLNDMAAAKPGQGNEEAAPVIADRRLRDRAKN
jgi:hypothetical protein